MYTLNRDWESLEDAPLEFSGECFIEPKTWERPRPFIKPNGRMSSILPAQTRNYEKACRAWMRDEYWGDDYRRPMDDADGALRFEAEFSMRRTDGHPKSEVYSNVKPDIDNLARAFLESFYLNAKLADDTRMCVISTDTPIVSMSLSRRWAKRYEWPGTRFSLTHDGDEGVAFSDELLSLDSYTPDRKGETGFGRRILQMDFDDLPPAPTTYARYVPIPPVPWMNPVLFGNRMGSPSEMRTFQARFRRRAMRDYGLRKPMDGWLMLELEVLLPEKGYPSRWMQWLVLLDYAKNLMDGLAWRFDGQAIRTRDDVALGALAQDSRVCALTATMRHCEGREVPGMRFRLSPVNGEDDVAPIFDHIETGCLF